MTNLFTIRDAREDDLALIDTFAAMEGMDCMPGIERIRVAVNDDDVVVGFCRLQDDACGIAYVNPIVTYMEWRGQGVGRALIEDAHARAGELRLIARGESIGFYRKMGFVDMSWEMTDQSAASEDCDGCPFRETCGPQPMRLAPDMDRQALSDYYAALPREFTFASRCKMTVLGDIRGKRVVDVDCRRGKGVVKLSDYVGPAGFALGVDPSPEWVQVGLSFMDGAWRKNGLPHNNMDYRVGYAEDLAAAGVEDGSFDVVFANSSINLAFDPRAAFAEFSRVLRPGGVLIYDSVVADAPRDAQVVDAARRMGNAVQAALSCAQFEDYARQAGFDAPEYHDELPVAPTVGFKDDEVVPVAPSGESVVFVKTTALVRKPCC